MCKRVNFPRFRLKLDLPAPVTRTGGPKGKKSLVPLTSFVPVFFLNTYSAPKAPKTSERKSPILGKKYFYNFRKFRKYFYRGGPLPQKYLWYVAEWKGRHLILYLSDETWMFLARGITSQKWNLYHDFKSVLDTCTVTFSIHHNVKNRAYRFGVWAPTPKFGIFGT